MYKKVFTKDDLEVSGMLGETGIPFTASVGPLIIVPFEPDVPESALFTVKVNDFECSLDVAILANSQWTATQDKNIIGDVQFTVEDEGCILFKQMTVNEWTHLTNILRVGIGQPPIVQFVHLCYVSDPILQGLIPHAFLDMAKVSYDFVKKAAEQNEYFDPIVSANVFKDDELVSELNGIAVENPTPLFELDGLLSLSESIECNRLDDGEYTSIQDIDKGNRVFTKDNLELKVELSDIQITRGTITQIPKLTINTFEDLSYAIHYGDQHYHQSDDNFRLFKYLTKLIPDYLISGEEFNLVELSERYNHGKF